MKRVAAWIGLVVVYGLTRLISWLLPARDFDNDHSKILVICTFYNVGWFVSHIQPLVEAGFQKVLVVADAPVVEMANVEHLCAPLWMQRIFTRAGAKFFVTVKAAFQFRPMYVMGYHLFPGAVIALLAARLAAARAIYQVTGGSNEWTGGGWQMENPVLAALGKPSTTVERLSTSVIRQFDKAIVRGNRTLHDLRMIGFEGTTEIITGSAPIPEYTDDANRDIDVVFVGRLVEIKRIDRLLEIIDRLGKMRELNVTIVGSGPEEKFLRREFSRREIDYVELLGQVKTTTEILQRSKIMLLTSRSEGVSIAMLEAMGAGVVPVVSDVGDLRSVIVHGRNGFLVAEDDLSMFVRFVDQVLNDPNVWHRMSAEARNFVLKQASVSAIAKKWRASLDVIDV